MTDHSLLALGTYHKTGTVWIQRVARTMAETLGWRFIDSARNDPDQPLDGPTVVFDDHSRFAPAYLGHPGLTGFRIIRDPRDIIISGAHYHARANEPWLKKPEALFEGLSYRDRILSCPTPRARYQMEMAGVALSTWQQINGTFSKDYQASVRALPACRYEDLMVDPGQVHLDRLIGALRIPPVARQALAEAFEAHSLWGGRLVVDPHVRSGRTAQWLKVFDRPLAQAFLRLYGDALITHGYQSSHRWVEQLPKHRRALDLPNP